MILTLTDKKTGHLLMRVLVHGEVVAQGSHWIMSDRERESLKARGITPGPLVFGAFGQDLELMIEEDFSHAYLKRIIEEGLDSDDPKKPRRTQAEKERLNLSERHHEQ